MAIAALPGSTLRGICCSTDPQAPLCLPRYYALQLIMQYNVHPIMQDLENYSKSRMRRVVAFSLGACSVVYAVAGGCGYAVFGRCGRGALRMLTQVHGAD